MTPDSEDDFVDRRSKKGVWVHWIGDFVSLVIMLITFSVGYGKMQAQSEEDRRAVAEVKHTLEQEKLTRDSERKELKTDIQNQLTNINNSLGALDSKLTAIMLDNRKR